MAVTKRLSKDYVDIRANSLVNSCVFLMFIVRRSAPQKKARSSFMVVNPCAKNPCKNNGTCNAIPGGYECDCPMTWEGDNCEEC